MKFLDKNFAYIIITSDTDSDSLIGDMVPVEYDKSILGWDGFSEGKEIFTNEINKFATKNNINIPISWFMRCDNQIFQTHGSYTYLFDSYKLWWLDRIRSGDEIQWHAHVYKRNHLNKWIQKTGTDEIVDELYQAKLALSSKQLYPKVIRIGESYHSTELMTALPKLGLEADSTALPGRKRIDLEKKIDWEATGNDPYRPSKDNYRITGDQKIDIWEIPMTTIPTIVSYDKQPLLRYVNLSFHTQAFLPDLVNYFSSSNILVTMTHPFELVKKFLHSSHENHPLIAFDPRSISNNLNLITNCALKSGLNPVFLNIGDLLAKLKKFH